MRHLRLISQKVHQLIRSHKSSTRQTTGHSFANGNNIGDYIVVLEPKECTSTSKSWLYLIQDKQCPNLLTALFYFCQIVILWSDKAGPSLYSFQYNPRCTVGNLL